MNYALVFDVESVGLNGEGFAVGWVAGDLDTGVVTEEGYYGCNSGYAEGNADNDQFAKDIRWLDDNCLPHLPEPNCNSTREVRDRFWEVIQHWKHMDARIFAWIGWPVEARFLARSIDDAPGERNWQGPFPLHEIAEYIDLARELTGFDLPERNADELPAHNPLNDSRKSFRDLHLALKALRNR